MILDSCLHRKIQGLLFATESGVLNSGEGSYDTAVALANRLSELRAQDAQASNQADKDAWDAV